MRREESVFLLCSGKLGEISQRGEKRVSWLCLGFSACRKEGEAGFSGNAESDRRHKPEYPTPKGLGRPRHCTSNSSPRSAEVEMPPSDWQHQLTAEPTRRVGLGLEASIGSPRWENLSGTTRRTPFE